MMKIVSDEIKKAHKLWYDGGKLSDNTPRENAGDVLIDHLEAVVIKLKDELAKSRTYCDETFAELNERNILIVELEEKNYKLRNCGNCKRGSGKASQVCLGCHGFEDVNPEAKKTYLLKWNSKY